MNEKQRAKLINAYLVGAITEEEFMAHAGIPGMRWGYTKNKRNGGRIASEDLDKFTSGYNDMSLSDMKQMTKDIRGMANSQKQFDNKLGKKIDKAYSSDNPTEAMKQLTNDIKTELSGLKGGAKTDARAQYLMYTKNKANDLKKLYEKADDNDKASIQEAFNSLADITKVAFDPRTNKQKAVDLALAFTPVGGLKTMGNLMGMAIVANEANVRTQFIDQIDMFEKAYG